MKPAKHTAALLAAITAVSSLSFNPLDLNSSSAVFADQTTATEKLPDWIPVDLETAIAFRNTYGATHIENDLICIVHESGNPQMSPHFEVNGTYAAKDPSFFFEKTIEMIPGADDAPYYMVSVYRPKESGTMTISYKNDIEQTDYTFQTDTEMNIIETDLYGWLPDSAEEYRTFSLSNTPVSVKDQYVVFCLSQNAGTAYHWSNKDDGSKCFALAAVSKCSKIEKEPLDGGAVNTVYAYKAVKDGYAKITYDYGSDLPDGDEHEQRTADCAVFDDAKHILLSGQMRATLLDYDTGEPILFDEQTQLSISTDISYHTPEGSVSTGPILIMETNPAIVDSNIGSSFDADSFSFGLDSYSLPKGYALPNHAEREFYSNGTIKPENSMTVTRFDNGSADVVFKVQFTPTGDVSDDGTFNVSDAVLFQKWLLSVPDTKLTNWKAADFCHDNKLNAVDLALMKRALTQTSNRPVAVNVHEQTGGVVGANTYYKVYRDDTKCYLSCQDLTFHSDALPQIMQISEQDYLEIMSQDYEALSQEKTEPSDEIILTFELSYPDGSQKTINTYKMPDLLIKLKTLKNKYSSYVEPDEYVKFGSQFYVSEMLKDGLNLYSGPGFEYEVITSIPRSTRMTELGFQKNTQNWLFTEYKEQYGWIPMVTEDGKTTTVRFEAVAAKPVIYLYPEQETDVHVALELTEADLSTTYPKYDDGWDVTAYPDGKLVNKADGSHHRYLFWDAVNCRTRFDFSKGFCVAGSDTERFLKEKLTYMGLTEDEMNEFIVYWLPLMEHNAYNLISFQGEAYTDSAKLTITPTPDSECRIFMAYVPLENAVEIEPQTLETFERQGFAVVEWGGIEIRS